MKKYLVFAFWTYYPSGGMEDFIGDTDTLEEAKEMFKSEQAGKAYMEGHIYDTVAREIVWNHYDD
jgi:hypothetical protein